MLIKGISFGALILGVASAQSCPGDASPTLDRPEQIDFFKWLFRASTFKKLPLEDPNAPIAFRKAMDLKAAVDMPEGLRKRDMGPAPEIGESHEVIYRDDHEVIISGTNELSKRQSGDITSNTVMTSEQWQHYQDTGELNLANVATSAASAASGSCACWQKCIAPIMKVYHPIKDTMAVWSAAGWDMNRARDRHLAMEQHNYIRFSLYIMTVIFAARQLNLASKNNNPVSVTSTPQDSGVPSTGNRKLPPEVVPPKPAAPEAVPPKPAAPEAVPPKAEEPKAEEPEAIAPRAATSTKGSSTSTITATPLVPRDIWSSDKTTLETRTVGAAHYPRSVAGEEPRLQEREEKKPSVCSPTTQDEMADIVFASLLVYLPIFRQSGNDSFRYAWGDPRDKAHPEIEVSMIISEKGATDLDFWSE
ncbi:MAG: hypothetical protein M1837_003369 [Sclerophora amabilis]|nr:MAG: hypothetical protein M1837_003369 [Sclerophora amabilis]